MQGTAVKFKSTKKAMKKPKNLGIALRDSEDMHTLYVTEDPTHHRLCTADMPNEAPPELPSCPPERFCFFGAGLHAPVGGSTLNFERTKVLVMWPLIVDCEKPSLAARSRSKLARDPLDCCLFNQPWYASATSALSCNDKPPVQLRGGGRVGTWGVVTVSE